MVSEVRQEDPHLGHLTDAPSLHREHTTDRGATATTGGTHDRQRRPEHGCPRHHRAGPRLLGDPPLSWEKWVERYEAKGYRVLVPTYPGFEGGVEALREDPSPIEALTFPAIIEHFEGIIIGELEKPPIIIGHSAGGVLTQILLDHGYGAAGVAIDSVPAEGIRAVVPVSRREIRSLCSRSSRTPQTATRQ
jgi:pimeloyl-ACP methyl ester carboxylesterase